jgi:hypothetical protein
MSWLERTSFRPDAADWGGDRWVTPNVPLSAMLRACEWAMFHVKQRTGLNGRTAATASTSREGRWDSRYMPAGLAHEVSTVGKGPMQQADGLFER